MYVLGGILATCIGYTTLKTYCINYNVKKLKVLLPQLQEAHQTCECKETNQKLQETIKGIEAYFEELGVVVKKSN